MWGYIILGFAAMWITQIVLSSFQMKHYRQTLQELSKKYKSGYLGVGVDKRRIGIGTVIIIITNENGLVIDSKKLEGVTVFQRFETYSSIIGESIIALENEQQASHSVALIQAIQQVKKEMNK